MRTWFLSVIVLCLPTGCGKAVVEVAQPTAPEPAAASKALADVDRYFVERYGADSNAIGKTTRPVLVIVGFNYQMLLKDGTEKALSGPVSPFNELKAVSHVGPCLFAIGAPHWKDPKDASWKKQLADYQPKVAEALRLVEQVNWDNEAWPGQGEKLRDFMRHSLQMAGAFVERARQQDTFPKEEYEKFATAYLPTMVATMYLADLADTSLVLKKLGMWKQEMGEKEWNELYVVIIGSKGRTTAGLTPEANTAARTVASLMAPARAETRILVAPTATTRDQALATLGEVLSARALADATFTSKDAKEVSGLYEALKKPAVPLALKNVEEIIAAAREGKIRHPLLGVGPPPEKK